MSDKVFLELADKAGRIDVDFTYNLDHVHKVRQVAGRSYVKTPHKHWTVPADMAVCRQLRSLFGDKLVLGPKLRSWASQQAKVEAQLGRIALADTGTLERLPTVLPRLYQAIHLGPAGKHMTPDERAVALAGPGSYQTADVAFLSTSSGPMNANQQGLGKSPETIAAIFEAGLELGDHLVIAPSAAVDATWPDELEMWTAEVADDVGVFACLGNRAQRQSVLDAWAACTKPIRFLLVNPQMIQYRKTEDETPVARKAKPKDFPKACHCNRLKDPHWHYEPSYPELFETAFNTITIDECHKGNIRNHRSLTSFSISDLTLAEGGKKFALSGTPMKKRGSDIWGILHWLRPDIFTSYWRFAEMFFEVTNNGFGNKVGKLRPEMEDEFYRFLTPYVLRRTKAECLPWLPPKQYVDVWVTLEGKQLKQYKAMELDGCAALEDGGEVTTTSVLAEMTRLRQFSGALCTFRGDKVVPTRESAKLEALMQKLDETGVLDSAGETKTVIFSQFRETIELVATMLAEKGVAVETISGGTNKVGQRRAIKAAFQEGDLRVLCIVTTAGGVSLTLDAADSAHFLDESYAPDEDEQAEDRIHRASRIHNVTIYRYRAKGTVDEDIIDTSFDKAEAHARILDVRRSILRRNNKEQAA
jgi:SNF2 family DNA or RNA helicase